MQQLLAFGGVIVVLILLINCAGSLNRAAEDASGVKKAYEETKAAYENTKAAYDASVVMARDLESQLAAAKVQAEVSVAQARKEGEKAVVRAREESQAVLDKLDRDLAAARTQSRNAQSALDAERRALERIYSE